MATPVKTPYGEMIFQYNKSKAATIVAGGYQVNANGRHIGYVWKDGPAWKCAYVQFGDNGTLPPVEREEEYETRADAGYGTALGFVRAGGIVPLLKPSRR